jgi:hypothetical protein
VNQQQTGRGERHTDDPDRHPVEAEYETSPEAPYNRESPHPLGSAANRDCEEHRSCEIEKQRQYFDRGKPGDSV